MYTLQYINQVQNIKLGPQDLMYIAQGTLLNTLQGTVWGKKSKKDAYIYVCIFMTDSLYRTPETNTTLFSNCTPTNIL